MANRSMKAKILRNKRRGKFKNWKNNPKGGTQAPLRAYSRKQYSTISKDVELYHGQTLGARAAKAQNTARIPAEEGMARDVVVMQVPETQGLTFGRIINNDQGPLPRLVVLDKLQEKERTEWYQDREFEKWANQFNRVSLVKGLHHTVDVFFSGRTFVIVEQKPDITRRSVIYHSFEHAKRTWTRDRVRWVKE